MQPQFQSSFIPKRPVTDSQKVLAPVKTKNIFSTIATFIFLVTLIASGGLFGYQRYLDNKIAAADADLNAAREAFQIDKIQDLMIASAKLSSLKSLIENHYAVSGLVQALQGMTLKNVKLSSFEFKNNQEKLQFSLDMEAQTYNAVVQQSAAYKENGYINDALFSGFDLTDKGTVNVKVTGNVARKVISYKDLLASSTPQ